MKRAVILTHVPFEHEGTLGTALLDAGFCIDALQAGLVDFTTLDPEAPDLWVVLGGPIAVYESADYPFLSDELALLSRRLGARRPTLGICLGAQLIAAALGARISPGIAGKEIGWAPIHPAAGSGRVPILNALFDPGLKVLHWHGDTFELPPGAAHLASSALYPNQAFSVGHHGLALQFHAEVRLAELEPWYIGHAAELAQAKISVSRLRGDGHQYAPALELSAPPLWQACLEFLLQS